MNNALIVRNVSKTFDKFKLDNISFEVPGGSIVGVIGKNGCGKSTLDVEFRDKFYETIRELAADENKCVIYATHLVEELEHFADYILWLQKKDNTTSKFYYGSLDELRDSYRLVSGEKALLERIPKELVVGGRLSESSNELLIRYDETKISAKINDEIGYGETEINDEIGYGATKLDHEIRQHMRYAELKEIMYYVQKNEIIKESGDEQ